MMSPPFSSTMRRVISWNSFRWRTVSCLRAKLIAASLEKNGDMDYLFDLRLTTWLLWQVSPLRCSNPGWSVCPTPLYESGRCIADLSWTNALEQSTSLLVFKRYATTAYDGRNFSILSVESISSPEPTYISPIDMRTIFAFVLSPGLNATSDDTEASNSLMYTVGCLALVVQRQVCR